MTLSCRKGKNMLTKEAELLSRIGQLKGLVHGLKVRAKNNDDILLEDIEILAKTVNRIHELSEVIKLF